MPSSSVTKQAEQVLEDVLCTLRRESESLSPVLCETERKAFVRDEESIRECLAQLVETESSWPSWFCLPPRPARKCLRDAEELLQRVKDDVNAKVRTRLTGESSLPPSFQGQGAAVDTGVPETNNEAPHAGSRSEQPSTVVTSPLNMRCSLSDSELNMNHAWVQGNDDCRSGISEAINTPLEMSHDRSGDSSAQRRRKPPPPPPSPRRVVQSNLSSESTNGLGDDTPRRSGSVRRPAPPPPQSRSSHSSITVSPNPRNPHPLPETSASRASGSPCRSHSTRRPAPPIPSPRTPRSPTHVSFSSSNASPLDPAFLSSISNLVDHIGALVPSVIAEGLSQQPHGRKRHHNIKVNCIDNAGSTSDGITLNNGSTNCSGAVIHKTALPQRLPQPI